MSRPFLFFGGIIGLLPLVEATALFHHGRLRADVRSSLPRDCWLTVQQIKYICCRAMKQFHEI
ncbi:hypothetical protein BN2475_1150013 [Paraburkholderia ribeironis]|uniref:Uncharacterized protein n=1 Tax=Paraburkholderia ribeironis TaxID=1247936 RepID=A0A1N7SNE5_9BURK|nr:hypothetical protein BN2475_1150013 [Paraburkholderia ribeironis]